ncbi:Serrate RNA effector molecule [Acorus gramineus]|uniref:Serrate RNA effector molecule n=1 Tax=Acorus gramineus TaxID=55184 RepID=A0AAV9B087_ACOGR|nr:Serrate RNA effector molecule [Acorus gramineus]
MAEVMDIPVDSSSLDHRQDRPSNDKDPSDGSPPPPPPAQTKRKDREYSRERRDDRDRRDDPTAGGPSRVDRERDYHRRSSVSPPPPYHRGDRRHSPPQRSPPPPYYKRARRDDGGYDRRRGSPRGGPGGFDDRRFGYDYGGGYDRGRGYGDERGRYMNRSSDWSDSGRAGYGDVSNAGVSQREGLMSYKQFIQELEDDILPAEAERRYEEYRSEYIKTMKRGFFDAHKDEEWLKDKYHPTNLVAVIERRNEHARTVAKEFFLDLQSGTLDLGPGVTASSSNKPGQGSDPNSEDDADNGGKRRRHGRGPAKENDLHSAAPKANPVCSEPRRVQIDIEQAQALVCKLDTEKGIEENVLGSSERDKLEGEKSHGGSMGPIIIIRGLTSVKGLEGVELLDTLITYLWRVHGVDYYGMIETNEAKGLRHVRVDSKNHEGPHTNWAEWEKKLDTFWNERFHGQDPLEKMTAKEKIDKAASEILDPYVRKIRDEKYGWKYGCGAKGCTKLFHAAEFVHKHLRLKHVDLVMELTSKLRDDLYFENYMNDPNAPGGTPVMQPSAPRDRQQRRRPGLDSRLRDDRGGRREHVRSDKGNDEEKYDKIENSPSRDFVSSNGGPEGGNSDEAMYDAFGAQGLRGAPPFASDIPPPPILMPVPGAGPLGPFVPAPPEVAMRMLREQGGPSPFEGNGGPRGRKNRLGPPIGGPTPIIAPPFRQDPRGIRSYQDLDAPEDEVTVIDYRSL